MNRNVLTYPDPFLRKVSEPLALPDGSLDSLVQDMFEAMEEEGGIGLAAPQIGVSKRVIVISVDEKGFGRLALVNPRIISSSAKTVIYEEGCLSVPGVKADVARPATVVVEGMTRSGRLVEISAADLVARVLQHEIDHLDGVLFIDRLAPEERRRVDQDLAALRRRHTALA